MENMDTFEGPVDVATLFVLIWALALQVIAGLLATLRELEPPTVADSDALGGSSTRYSLGKGVNLKTIRSPLKRLYTETERSGSGEEETIRLRGVTPLGRPINEAKAIERVIRGVSLLSVAVMAVVRFTQDEPILNLF